MGIGMKLKTQLVTIFMFFSIISYSAITHGNDDVKPALTNFLYDTSKCTIFYGILGEGIDSSGTQWTNGQSFQSLSEELALSAFEIAKQINMTQETVMVLMQDYSQQMGELINFDIVNLRLLTDKHGQFCKIFVENPEQRLNYWMNKESN
jgi:hypothetical protein